MATAETVQPPSPEDVSSSKKRKTEVDEIEVDLSLPEPPSKKAKRLLKKGKPLPVKPNSDDEGDGIPSSKAKSKKGEKQDKASAHGIWIGNLPFTVTRAELFKWLVDSSGGAINEDNITRVNLPVSKMKANPAWRSKEEGDGANKEKFQNKGFAYVDFDAEAAAVAAMALTETEIIGRKVLIKDSKSFEGRPKKVEESKSAAEGNTQGTSTSAKGVGGSKKIFVGNLGFDINQDDLYAQFEKCGEIEWAKLATFEDSGKCKGFGWVKFREEEAAQAAVKGFVKIKEMEDTEEDFVDSTADQDEEGKKAEKKFKTRKWWVNRLKGRELKIQFAEDDQSRYKKRFGKDAPTRKRGDAETRTDGGDRKPKKFGGYGDSQVASYLTGAVAKPEGKKTTFE